MKNRIKNLKIFRKKSKNIITTRELGNYILETGTVPTHIVSSRKVKRNILR